MNSEPSPESLLRFRGDQRQVIDHNTQTETTPTHETIHNAPREIQTSNKLLDYLLFKHGAEFGVVGWISCIAAILNVAWAIKGFNTTESISHASLTQAALANQINVLRICLDYPEMGVKNVTMKGFNFTFRTVPCEAFLKALDFDALSKVLIDPRIVPDVRSPPQLGDIGKPPNIGDWDDSFRGMLKVFFGLIPGLFSSEFWKLISAILIFMVSVLVGIALIGGTIYFLNEQIISTKRKWKSWRDGRTSGRDPNQIPAMELGIREV